MKVKICGLTRPREAVFLNDAGADYAGFVFFPKSRRNVTMEQAEAIRKQLSADIKTVAVTVSPEKEQIRQIMKEGFDIIQIHGDLDLQRMEMISIPIWYAINFSDEQQLEEKKNFLNALPQPLADKIQGIVVDGAEYGSGKTFDWETEDMIRKSGILKGRSFILAGGLNEANVREGIKRFAPDIVDVSSGVEGTDGKEHEKINAFIRKVRNNE